MNGKIMFEVWLLFTFLAVVIATIGSLKILRETTSRFVDVGRFRWFSQDLRRLQIMEDISHNDCNKKKKEDTKIWT